MKSILGKAVAALDLLLKEAPQLLPLNLNSIQRQSDLDVVKAIETQQYFDTLSGQRAKPEDTTRLCDTHPLAKLLGRCSQLSPSAMTSMGLRAGHLKRILEVQF